MKKIISVKNVTRNPMITWILAGLLIIVVGYLITAQFQAKQQQKDIAIFQQGGQTGYQQAIVDIINRALTCEQVPLFVQNQTINLIAVECLQAAQQAQAGQAQ